MSGRYTLRNIWEDLALPELALSFKLAIGPTKMILAFCAVFSVCAIGYLMDTCTKSVVVVPSVEMPQNPKKAMTELHVYLDNPDKVQVFIDEYKGQSQRRGVFSTLWTFVSARFHESTIQLLNFGSGNIFSNFKYALYNIWLCIRAMGWAFHFHLTYSLIYFIFSFFVFSLIGGAICRCAALEFAQDEKPGLFESIQYSFEHYRSYLSAPLIPLGMVGLFSLVVILVGMLTMIPRVGELILALSFVFLLFFGLIITLMGIGVVAGGLLLYPAIAYEGTTGLDSIGRAFSYVLNRPVWMFYYVSAASVFGTIFYLILRFMIFLILRFTYLLLSAGMTLFGETEKLERIWSKPEIIGMLQKTGQSTNWSESTASLIIYLFLLGIVGLLLSYIVSYLFSSSTVIYALLRKKVDSLEPDKVFIHLDQVKQ